MKRTRPLYAGLLVWTLLGFPLVSHEMSSPVAAHADEALRADVAKPLQQAGALIKSGKYKDALAKIHDAEGVSGKNANETFMIERMRLSAAMPAGDLQQASKAADVVLASSKLSSNEKLQVMEGMISLYSRAGNNQAAASWVARYMKEGGNNPRIAAMAKNLRFYSGDYANLAKELGASVRAEEKAGRRSSEEDLQLLANCYLKLKDEAAYAGTMIRLVSLYPKKDYWTNVLSQVRRKSGFANRLSLDHFRLKLATDNLKTAPEYMEMAQLAVQEGFNTEAKKVVDAAYAANVFGSGQDADRQKRLRDMVAKRLADEGKAAAQLEADANANADGSAAINVGLNLIQQGQTAKGVSLVEAGLKKGNFKREDDAKLRAGIAFVVAGQKAKAAQVLKGVNGNDGSSDLAKLWAIK
ncbi:hypothetical protein KSF73_08930 [Burkholderiaceae bacterium DAT-1]|nr:hypothetical protein [Burkholderiaceae bacterium DAT-1]